MSSTQTRTQAGITVPVAGTYTIDPSHSSVEFKVRHLGLSKVRGGFSSFSGEVVVGEHAEQSSVHVSIDAGSFSTGNDDRDSHVRSPDFLDVEQHPTLTYTSSSVRQQGHDWVVEGELDVHGQVRPVALAVEFEGATTDPWGNDRIAFSATTEIDRDDFGLTWNQALEAGGVVIGKSVTISIEVQAVAS